MWTRLSDIDRMFGAMDQFRSRMDRLFPDLNRPYREESGWYASDGYPRTNLYDTGSQLEIKAEMTGMAREDINIRIQGNYLEISGNRKADAPEGYKTHRIEREPISFTRSFTLPSEADADKATASLKNGILTLLLPKAEAATPKKIAVS
ncbi:MAG: Hsp20/alpha crystallin family protein [Desulfurivibrionaceae bacterium]